MTLPRLLTLLSDEIPSAILLRHRLHSTPEIGGAEYETCRAIRELLPVPYRSAAGTGLIARVGPSGIPSVVVRAELDALEITEETDAPFAATNGHMHACGHDVHASALLALVRAAHRMGDDLPVPLVAVFQPSEERQPSGAVALLETGELTPEQATAMVAVHVHPDLPWGSIGAEAGAVNAAADAVLIEIEGRGGHAAYPHRTRDPVLALSHLVVAVHGLVGRHIDPLHGATITVGAVHAGSAENVIPSTAQARLTIRAMDESDQEELRAAVRKTAVHVAEAFGCTAELTFVKSEPVLVNDPALALRTQELAAGAGFTVSPPWRSCGGDDFAHYGAHAPSLMAFVGLNGAPGFIHAGLHDRRFLPPDATVAAVARAQALCYVAAITPAAGRPAAGTSV
ncbi:M20 family metallopeptidase [Nonomuraea salmonea]|uniref:M20 family metallopeptidase n=1 Tax=Nonomuraea salmonea TaxID=46181 RepID=A0ABV5NEN7_9ACTN